MFCPNQSDARDLSILASFAADAEAEAEAEFIYLAIILKRRQWPFVDSHQFVSSSQLFSINVARQLAHGCII